MMDAAAGAVSWTRVATLGDFQGSRQFTCRSDRWELILLRVGSDVIVLHNYCTHLGKPLTSGRVMGGQIMCPYHGACFDVRSGAAVSGPAVFPLHRFASRLDGEDILADLSKPPPNLAAGFAG
jgi:nitrite reductase/ring-hydroxylating ferredoxin subunit